MLCTQPFTHWVDMDSYFRGIEGNLWECANFDLELLGPVYITGLLCLSLPVYFAKIKEKVFFSHFLTSNLSHQH